MIALKARSTLPRSFNPEPSRETFCGIHADRSSEAVWTIRNILVPIDFSPRSDLALARAVELARHHTAALTVLHIVDISPGEALSHCGSAENLMKQLWETGISGMSRVTECLAQNRIKFKTLMVEGIPAESIVEKSSEYDLLVIGEPRIRPVWRLFIRHSVRQIVERAECPVLVVHQERTGNLSCPVGGGR